MKYLHIAGRVFNTPLMIHEGKLQTILGVLSPRMGFDLPAIAAAAGGGASILDDEDEQDAIAVINVTGSLVNRMAMEPLSSFSSYERIGMKMQAALDDPTVRGIMLRIESYGGEVAGAFDLADRIRIAAQQKPVWASVDDNAYSAAFLQASQANRIYVTRTAGVGSVGVIAMHFDWSGNLQQEGIVPTAIFAGAKKTQFSPYQPLGDDAAAFLQAEVDASYQRFAEYVAAGRRMTIDQVKATEAGTYTGQAGIDIGFADRLGTFQEAMNDFAAALSPASMAKTGGNSAGMKGVRMDNQATAEYTAETQAAAEQRARAEGRAEGVAAERARISAILGASEATSREQLARHLAFNTDTSADAARPILAAAPVASAPTQNHLAEVMKGVANPNVGTSAGESDEASLIAGVLAFANKPTKGGKQ